MRESDLTKRMVQRLRARGAWCAEIHGSIYTAGLPDIVGVYRGTFLGLEVKLPGKERSLTRLQSKTLEKINEAGGMAEMITEVKDVDEILDEIDEELG